MHLLEYRYSCRDLHVKFVRWGCSVGEGKWGRRDSEIHSSWRSDLGWHRTDHTLRRRGCTWRLVKTLRHEWQAGGDAKERDECTSARDYVSDNTSRRAGIGSIGSEASVVTWVRHNVFAMKNHTSADCLDRALDGVSTLEGHGRSQSGGTWSVRFPTGKQPVRWHDMDVSRQL